MAAPPFSPSHQADWDNQRIIKEVLALSEEVGRLRTVQSGLFPVGMCLPYTAVLALPGTLPHAERIAGYQQPPDGWLWARGQEVPRARYLELYRVLRDQFGPSTNAQVFRLPDLRGRVPIGVDGTTVPRVGSQVGSSMIAAHTHGLNNGRASISLENGLVYIDQSALAFTSNARHGSDWNGPHIGPVYGASATSGQSITCRANANYGDLGRKVMVVMFTWAATSTRSISSVTWQGGSITGSTIHADGAGTVGLAWYYVSNPSGTGEAIATLDALTNVTGLMLRAWILSGVRAQAPEAKSASIATGTSTTPSSSVTPLTPNAHITDILRASTVSSSVPTQTAQAEIKEGEFIGVTGHQQTNSEKTGPGSPGATTMAWSLGSSVAWRCASAAWAVDYAEPANSARLTGTSDSGGGGSNLQPSLGMHWLIYAGKAA